MSRTKVFFNRANPILSWRGHPIDETKEESKKLKKNTDRKESEEKR
jgi:hypothetical protein